MTAVAAARSVGALRRQAAAALAAGGIDTPDFDARLLVAHALGMVPGDLLLRADDVVPDAGAETAMAFVARRRAGEPVGRILGRRAFWSLEFDLSADTLEPRPDTETVVEAALACLPDAAAPLRILDLGTGTGAILAALLAERPLAVGIGLDRAEGAVRTARANLARAGLSDRGALFVGDWGAALGGEFDLVVSNPPYIAESEMADLPREVRLFDPARALVAGRDGLDAYRAIAADLPRLLAPGGYAVLELGQGQERDVAGLLAAAGLTLEGPARRDLAGVPRAIVACRP